MRTGAAAGDRQVHGSVAARAGGSDAECERGVGGRQREQSQRAALARLRLPPARPLRVHLRAQQRLLAPVIQSLILLTTHRSLFADRCSLLTSAASGSRFVHVRASDNAHAHLLYTDLFYCYCCVSSSTTF